MVKSSIWLQALRDTVPYQIPSSDHQFLVVNLSLTLIPPYNDSTLIRIIISPSFSTPDMEKTMVSYIYLGDFRGYSPKRGSSLIQGCLAKVVQPPSSPVAARHCSLHISSTAPVALQHRGRAAAAAARSKGKASSGSSWNHLVATYWLVNSYPGTMVFCNPH